MNLKIVPFAALTAALLLPGCSSGEGQDMKAQAEQMEKLRQENAGLAQAQTENETVQRLRKENEELPKLRSQYQEAARLRKENEQLRQQIARLTPAGAAGALASNAVAAAASAEDAAAKKKEKGPYDDLTLNDGDELLVEPRFLK